MATFVLMPKLGMDMEEGTIVEWFKNEGNTIKKGEPLFEVISDKANIEVEATIEGTLLKMYYKADDTVPVGRPIAAIGEAGEIAPDIDSGDSSSNMKEEPFVEEVNTPVHINSEHDMENNRIKISPRAKKLALDNNIEYHNISGTGSSGRIVERDIKNAIESRVNKSFIPEPNVSDIEKDDTIIPLSGIRKIIASRMMKSLSSMAQANHRMDVDMTNIMDLRKKLNEAYKERNIKVSVLDLLIKIVTLAIKDYPMVNSSMGSDDSIVLHNYVNMGIAVATDNGLVVPVIYDTHEKNIYEISSQSKLLIDKARNGKLLPEEMSQGTFTITNLGMYDVDSFTAIINPPEAAILGVGKICEKPVVENGRIAIRLISTLSLTYDHRIIDGAPAAQFLQRVKLILENPFLLI